MSRPPPAWRLDYFQAVLFHWPRSAVFMSERFEATYRRHVEAVFRFALACVRRRDIAEELTSEAFLSLYRNFEGIDESRLPGWLIAVVRNRSRDYWRRQVTEQNYLRTLVDQPHAAAVPSDQGLFASCDLKPVHRVCLRLRYVDGLSRAEIASATGLSENQVKGHLQYSLRLLRAALAGQE
jgi:RNA polymerase sigma-70 factor, ECF subfamily